MSSSTSSSSSINPTVAFGQHVMAQEVERSFVQQCIEQERLLKEEEEALRSVLTNILNQAQAPALEISGTGILYMKTTTSEKRLTMDRIHVALVALQQDDGAALREAYTVLIRNSKTPTARAADVVTLAIVRQLQRQCVTQRHIPTVAKRIPSQLKASTVAPRPVGANSTIPASVYQYLEVQSQLRAVRKHKNEGRQRCREVLDMSGLQIQQLLSAMGTDSEQMVRVVPAGTVPVAERAKDSGSVSTLLPTMPALLPEHAQRDATKAEQHPSMLHVELPNITTPSTMRFRQRVPTISHARAPRLKDFTDNLVSVVTTVVGARQVKDENALVALLQTDSVFSQLTDVLADRFIEQSTPETPAIQAPKLSIRRF
jgi:hypothetical protein